MPNVDPTQYLMETLSVLTRGLVTDMQTLIMGLVVCAFMLMALDILKDLLLIPLVTAALNPVDSYRSARDRYYKHKFNSLPAGLTVYSSPNASDRREVEISPLRQYDLDLSYSGVDSLEPSPVSIYDQKQNHWERDGVELSDDRYQALEEAMQETEYNERMKHRLSGDEVEAMFDMMRRK